MSVCTNCNGAKRVMGMGMVQKQCPTCQGTGFEAPAVSDQSKRIVELEAQLAALELTIIPREETTRHYQEPEMLDEKVAPKRPGRPKKA